MTRRAQGGAQPVNPALSAGDLVLDFDAAEVYKNSNPVRLTLTELRILEQLARNAQRAVSYEARALRYPQKVCKQSGGVPSV